MTGVNQDSEHLRLLTIFHQGRGWLSALVACISIIHVVIGLFFMLSPSTFGSQAVQASPVS